jgi:penicillin V acylase-like amidase (Ntn superfamily)
MKKIGVIILLFFFHDAIACTTFFINKNGQLIFGGNYDWVTGAGIVCTNHRGLLKTSMKTEDGKTISWVSKYGSITFNQYGKEFPTGGMNEKGLVVELMWLDGARYPSPDERPSVGVLQWIQYQLDNSKNIEDVIATDKILRIASVGTVPLHYLVADANGNAATIEFLDGKMVVHTGKDLPFPVLTNDRYDESIRRTMKAGGSQSFNDNSIDRFNKACKMVGQWQEETIDMPVVNYAFNILDKVSQGDWTKWSIVYDLRNKQIHFKSLASAGIKTVAFNSFDFFCSATPRMFDINKPAKGEVSGFFQDFSVAGNQPFLETAIRESQGQVKISEETREAILNYNREIKCR